MREIRDIRLRLEFYQSNSKMSKKFGEASEISGKDKGFLDKIIEDFKTPKDSKAGAICLCVYARRQGKRLKKFRAGIEGCISAAKRAYGLAMCTWKGWLSFQSYVWLSVIAFNLSIFTNALLK